MTTPRLRMNARIGLAILMLLRASLVAEQAPWPKPLAITHVTVIDTARGAALEDMTVLIVDTRVAAVGRTGVVTLPQHVHVVDASGKFLIPGLWDMHVHLFGPHGVLPGGTHAEARVFPLLIANGVIGVRDMWTDPEDIKVARQWNSEIEAGRWVGPRVLVSSRIVDGEPPRFPNSLIVRNAAEARQAVQSLKAAGAGFIKVYSSLSREAYFAIADESKRGQIPFAGHVAYDVSAAEASDAGQRTIEHMTGILARIIHE